MKILVIRFSSLGDVVLITPLFKKIKDLYPSSEISFLTNIKYTELFNSDPNIDNIISYDASGGNLIYFLKFLKSIRKKHYDIIIDCHIIPRSVLFYFLGYSVKRRRLNKYTIQRRFMVITHKRRQIPHIVKRYLATIDKKNVNNYSPKIYLQKEEQEMAENFLNKKSGGRRVVGFVAGASKKTKIWKLEHLQKCAFELSRKKDVFIVFFGNKTEIPLVAKIKKGLNNNYLDLVGKTNFRELASFLELCDVLLTTDSGAMHIAVAVGTPVVAIFGPTVPEFGFAPYDQKSIILSKPLSCRPCSLHGTDTCPLGHHNCMKLIQVEEVLTEIEKLLYKNQCKRTRGK